MRCRAIFALAMLGAVWACGPVVPARADPILQLYLEGGTYEDSSETWTLPSPVSSGDAPMRLWTIGNVDGPGGKGTIYNVRLAVAYEAAAGDIQIDLTPATTDDYGGFFDPSLPDSPQLIQTVSDGSVPRLSSGKNLPSHGIYGDGIVWQEFALGDFDLVDSPVANFIDEFPTAPTAARGQISVYEVSVTNSSIDPVAIHFDLYDSVAAKNKARAKFAPFSHDAEGESGGDDGGGGGGGPIVPAPADWVLLLTAALALAGWHAVRRCQHTSTSRPQSA